MKKLLLTSFLLNVFNLSLIGQNTNNALHFQNNDYVNINNISQDIANLNSFTIEFWVRFDGNENTVYNVFYGANAGNYENRMAFRVSGPVDGTQGAAVVLLQSSTKKYLIGQRNIGDTRCHHLAFTYDNQACSLYVDGTLEASVNHNFEFKPTDVHSLGQEYDDSPYGTSDFYNGEIDDFRIWNYAKTQLQIENNKNTELAGNETGLLVYYDFNQGVAGGNNSGLTSLENKAQPTKNGTLVNFNLNNSTSNFVSGKCSDRFVEIEDYELLNQVVIGPNPTNGIIHINTTENIVSIDIKNSLGQIVLQPKLSHTIDVSNLPKACYFMELKDNNGTVRTIKVIKQ